MIQELRPTERRRQPRQGSRYACKVLHVQTRRWFVGETRDLSRGGALLYVECTRPLTPGDDVDVVMAWNGEPLLSVQDAVRARVVRACESGERGQIVALEFATALQGLRLAA